MRQPTQISETDAFEQQARANVDLPPRLLETFIKKGKALRYNLILRKRQQLARQQKQQIKDSPCMPSK